MGFLYFRQIRFRSTDSDSLEYHKYTENETNHIHPVGILTLLSHHTIISQAAELPSENRR